jgi:hypothetical protein
VGVCGQGISALTIWKNVGRQQLFNVTLSHHTHAQKQDVRFCRTNMVSSGVGNISLLLDAFYFRYNAWLHEEDALIKRHINLFDNYMRDCEVSDTDTHACAFISQT